MGVISADGIVGITNQTNQYFASAVSLLHRDLNINAKLKNNNAFGSLYWPGYESNKMILSDIPTINSINIGDTIVTGGMSAYFPKNIPIGEVSSFSILPSKRYYEIEVILFTNFSTLDHVFIVQNLEKPLFRSNKQLNSMLQKNIYTGISFVVLIALQFLVFSNINLFGTINPFVYLLFLIQYQLNSNQAIFIILCFLLGLFIDLILGTAGAHTIATLTVAYLRPWIVDFSFGNKLPTSPMPFSKEHNWPISLVSIGIIIGLHTILYYSVEYFQWHAFLIILKNAFLTAIITFIFIWLILGFNKPKK